MFIQELADAFERHGVVYCVVGGWAVNLHGIPRMTYDVDIVTSMDPVNLDRFQRAISDLKLIQQQPVDLLSLSDKSLRDQLRVEKNLIALTFTDPTNPLRELDLLINSSPDSEALIENSIRLENKDLALQVSSIEQLIVMKLTSGRQQDLADAELLQRLKKQGSDE